MFRNHFLLACVLSSILVSLPAAAGAEAFTGSPVVGNWIGEAAARVPGSAPFEAVHFQVTFFADGNVYWNDGHEVLLGHGTGHGQWAPSADGSHHATILFFGYDETAPGARGATLKLSLTGRVDPAGETMDGSLALTIFPPGSDPLAADGAGGVPAFGIFDFVDARALGEDPPIAGVVDDDLSDEYILGSWFGKAEVDDPATSPFHEVVMMLNFLPDRNIVATDALELLNPHTTAHGGPWDRPAGNKVFCPFLWTNLGLSDTEGNFKVRITGEIDPADVDSFAVGTVAPVAFPPGADPLDPTDAAGAPIGPFTIVHMERIKLKPSETTVVGVDRSGDPLVGSWYGHAVADDPSTAPFDEFFVLPTFFSRGNVLWNDSQESTYDHGSAFGEWQPNDAGGYSSTFVWLNMDLAAPIVFDGAVRGHVELLPDPMDPDRLNGSVELWKFPRDVIDLPDDLAGAELLGTYTFTDLRRIQDMPAAGPGLPCLSDATTLCLGGDGGERFEVRVDYSTTQGGGSAGSGQARPLASLGIDQGGLFWFFDPTNPEVMVKVLDGCDANSHYWVFFAATTNVGYELTVTDTNTGLSRTYSNPDGVLSPAAADVEAFACN